MKWSLSEFLNLVELRSQTWCFADLGRDGGFSIKGGECLYLYAALEGNARLAGVSGGLVELTAGDIVIILSGESHAVRSPESAAASSFEFLSSGEYADVPAHFEFGHDARLARVLCCRLKVKWPGGQIPKALPPLLNCNAKGLVDCNALVEAATGPGSCAVLTCLARLLFVSTFREHPDCQAVFRDSTLHDPIARAVQHIEAHPFAPWTVETLARKVGMSRANFAARFVIETGQTPFDVLTGERMRCAADILLNSDLKVCEIGERVGYRSESAFSRRFSEYFGISPSRMRTRAHGATAAGEANATGE